MKFDNEAKVLYLTAFIKKISWLSLLENLLAHKGTETHLNKIIYFGMISYYSVSPAAACIW